MTASHRIALAEHLTPEQKIERLRMFNDELADSLHRLSSFQKQVLSIQKCASIEDALDQMEVLLDEAVEFVYIRLYLKDEEGALVVHREMCPENLDADSAMVEWACSNQELTIIPIEPDTEGSLRSMLLLPLVGHGGTLGLLTLWLESDPSRFTQEDSTLLTMLARETASVIETLHFRQSIEKARATMADVVESVPHGIMAVDADGVVSVINSTLEFMFNVRRGDVLGCLYRETLPGSVAELIASLIADDEQNEHELMQEMHGIEETLGLSVNPMHVDDGEPIGYVIIARDLKLSREVAKLRELDSMKNDFLSLVSHELRTPLTSIMAYSETLLMEGMVDTEEERREYLHIIHDEGARLNRLINDVLDLTKLEAGKMDYMFEELSILDVIHTSIGSSMSLASQKKITLETDFEDGLQPMRIDSDRLMQVMMNVLSNAIKFTPDEGTITIHVTMGEPFEGRTVPTVTVAVQDTGIGIALENLNRVFSKFEQIENIDHHSVGTGLGMPICKQIIEEGHGGKIWIESEVGVGTTVLFRIPVA